MLQKNLELLFYFQDIETFLEMVHSHTWYQSRFLMLLADITKLPWSQPQEVTAS